jgi:hypothetical protein
MKAAGLAWALLLAILTGSLSGCVIVPWPVVLRAGAEKHSRGNLTEADAHHLRQSVHIVPGLTTRQEVLLMLGEPDYRGPEDGQFTYAAQLQPGGLHFDALALLVNGDAFVGALDYSYYPVRVRIRFDGRGVVSAVDQHEPEL